ncbi:putative RNA pseudouridine synthase 5 [Cocos nucifera]|nr:putative RNA pseudouridine synthase 5 [Cocos nucifera]
MAVAAVLSKQWPPSTPSARRPLYSFGVPWPEFNDGLSYTDIVQSPSSGFFSSLVFPLFLISPLIDFYSSKYKYSAPLQGWLHRIKNGQITVDGEVITDPSMVLRDGSKVVYHRLPWKEPSAPYVLEVLYEDDDMVNFSSNLKLLGEYFLVRLPLFVKLKKLPGILLCAKTKLAKSCLAACFAKGTENIGENRCEGEPGLKNFKILPRIGHRGN